MPRTVSPHVSATSIVLAGDDGNRQVYGDYLMAAGCQVTFASDSDAVLAQSLSLQPDVITIANRLAPLTGPQLCARLKADVRTAAIPVIIVMANAKGSDRRAAQAADCAVQIVQPVSPRDLFLTVQVTIERARALQVRARVAADRAGRLIAAGQKTPAPRRSTRPAPSRRAPVWDVATFLEAPERRGRIVKYEPGSAIYSQGDSCETVQYVKHGVVKLSVVSRTGREAIIGLIGPGHFFGEGCLAGHAVHLGSATAVAASAIVSLRRADMLRLLHEHHEVSDWFIAHMLERNSRIEADLVDQLFNSSERRLARALLLLARYGEQGAAIQSIPHISQATLAEMVGTTRSRINLFMRKFERLGFIEYKKGLKVNKNLRLVLSD